MWSITDIKISEQNLNIGKNIIIAPLAEGVYQLQFFNDNEILETGKIIVKK